MLRAISLVGEQKDASRRIPQLQKAGISRRRMISIGGGFAIAAAAGGLGAWRFGLFRARVDGNSVAVIPFKNLSGNADQSYFSDGLSEEMRSALARVSLLKAAAPTSSTRRWRPV